MAKRSFMKDVHYLYKKINSVSGGQACVHSWEDEKGLTVEIAPNDGYYKGGKFLFKIFPNVCGDYPENPPIVNCLTEVYHPNIDLEYDYEEEDEMSSNICVSILETGEWESHMNLEDCVQAILFLFYNPNWEDALSPLFASDLGEEEFAQNVKKSLEGGDIEGVKYERNYGFYQKDENYVDNQDSVNKEMNDLNKALDNLNTGDGNCPIIENVGAPVEESLAKETNNNVNESLDQTEQTIQNLTEELVEIVSESETKVTCNTNCTTGSAPKLFFRSLSVGDKPKGNYTFLSHRDNFIMDIGHFKPNHFYNRSYSFDFDNLMPCTAVLGTLFEYLCKKLK